MNEFSKLRKPELLAALNAEHSLRLRTDAALEAKSAECDALSFELASVKRRLDEVEGSFATVQSQLATLQRDQHAITSRAALMAEMRKLSQQGVPCLMRGDFLYHAQTKAILAQIVH